MGFHRGIDGSDPVRSGPIGGVAGAYERGHAARGRLGTGTLACPRCDAPVALHGGGVSVTDELGCPYCGHASVVRDFLSLAAPTRPARVMVRVVFAPGRAALTGG
jgi:DNA-directed RNA polymerase subunit RPC12/RpoP